MYINKSEVDRLFEKFSKSKNIWELADGELYNLCEKYPNHKSTEQVIAKLWFIGRTYAAALERRKNAVVTTNELYQEVAQSMGAFLDDRLAAIKKHTEYTAFVFKEVLELHKSLTESFVSNKEKQNAAVKRSLASKYLHFHCNDKFYIYDANALSAISKLVSERKKQGWSKIDITHYETVPVSNADNEYRKFCLRSLALHKYLEDKNLTVKQIDNFLLYCADEYYLQNKK